LRVDVPSSRDRELSARAAAKARALLRAGQQGEPTRMRATFPVDGIISRSRASGEEGAAALRDARRAATAVPNGWGSRSSFSSRSPVLRSLEVAGRPWRARAELGHQPFDDSGRRVLDRADRVGGIDGSDASGSWIAAPRPSIWSSVWPGPAARAARARRTPDRSAPVMWSPTDCAGVQVPGLRLELRRCPRRTSRHSGISSC